jgi:hypothetical protein
LPVTSAVSAPSYARQEAILSRSGTVAARRNLIAEPEGPASISRTVAFAVWTGVTRDTRPNCDIRQRGAKLLLEPGAAI